MAGTARRFGGVVLVLLGLLVTVVGVFATPAAAAPNQNNECNGAFQGSPEGSLAITSVPAAGDTDGADEIVITATWNTNQWVGDELDKIINCVKVNGALVDSLSEIDKPTENDGTHEFTIDLSGLDTGDDVCARVRLSGQPANDNPSTQKSNELCWTVTDGETPPPPADTFDITVSKTVVNGVGNETFTFKVDCDPVVLDGDNVAGTDVKFENGAAVFDLTNGGSKSITGLPEDTSCEISETVPGSPVWTTKINGTSDDDRTTVVAITVDGTAGDRAVAFENTRVNPQTEQTQTNQTPAVTPTQEAVVAGIQVTREAPAVAAAAAPATQVAALAATGLSPVLLALGLALVGLGALLVIGERKTARPAGNHYTS